MEVGIVRSRYGCRQAACATSALIAAAEAAGNCEEQTLRFGESESSKISAISLLKLNSVSSSIEELVFDE